MPPKNVTRSRSARLSSFAGGFSVQLWDHQGNRALLAPEDRLKTIDSKRALKGFRSPSRDRRGGSRSTAKMFNGHFLDARTLAFALTNEGHTSESASDEFEVPYTKRPVTHGTITEEYVTYCREDVEATAKLYASAMAEYRSPPDRAPGHQGLLTGVDRQGLPALHGHHTDPRTPAGLRPEGARVGDLRLLRWPGRVPDPQGAGPGRIWWTSPRCTRPSMPSWGLWSLFTASRDHRSRTTPQGSRSCSTPSDLEQCFDPDTWPEFVGIAQIVPEDDLLPCRARYGDGPIVEHRDQPADLHASRCGSPSPTWWRPRCSRARHPSHPSAALRAAARDGFKDLKTVRLRGSVEVDPTSMDFFTSVVEERQRIKAATKDHEPRCTCADCRTAQFLKVLANSGSYGIYAEMVRHELGGSQDRVRRGVRCGPESFQSRTGSPETPGEFCFPPIAACITGAARLMLALLEALVVKLAAAGPCATPTPWPSSPTRSGGLIPCPGGARTHGGRSARPSERCPSPGRGDPEPVRQPEPLCRSMPFPAPS